MFLRLTRLAIPLFLIQTSIACTVVDRGSFGPFERSLNTKNYGYSVIEDPTKAAPTKIVEVFEVRLGDCKSNRGWSDCENDRERSELKEVNKDNYPNDEYWYGWSVYFPMDYNNVFPTKTALGQFHQDGAHPVWMFQNSAGGYHLDDQVHGRTRKYYELISESELTGQWHQVEVHARWAIDDDGFFRVWINGLKKVDYKGQTMTARAVYFKYGVYRTFMSRYKNANDTDDVPTQVAYFSNVKRASSRESLSADIKSNQTRGLK